MQNKKVIFLVALAIVGFGLLYFFVFKEKVNSLLNTSVQNIAKNKNTYQPTEAQKEAYAKIQSGFVNTFPCGVTDFDSPRVVAMKCPEERMKKGEPVKVIFSGTVLDEKGNKLKEVKIKVNNGKEFFSDKEGKFNSEIEIDSSRKAIVIAADKFGYSPIRKIMNAQVPNQDWSAFEMTKEYSTDIVMRETEVKKVVLESEKDITITSEKYPGVSVSIPAGSLENSKGEIVTGEITGEITYLNPKDPKDAGLTPGFEHNGKQMIGINRKGEQVILKSRGMTFFHFKQKGGDEILQPKKGAVLTITQPIFEEDYKQIVDPKYDKIEAPTLEEDLKFKEQLGLKDGMSDEEIFEIYLKNDMIAYNYWYFNQRTGLWEEWPVAFLGSDIKNKVNIMKVTKLY